MLTYARRTGLLSAATVLGPLAFAAACGEGSAPGADALGSTVVAEPIPSPAAPSSGEPFLSSGDGGVYMSWLERSGEEHALRFARFDGAAWGEPRTVVRRGDFFVNWADFPSIRPGPSGTLWAHWLQRGGQGGYDYGIRIAHSEDGGATWSDPWTPHEDGTPTEHGFVSGFSRDDRLGFAWLDGRKTDPALVEEDPDHVREMTLRFREVVVGVGPEPEELLDGRVCDCCQTATTVTDRGPVVVYRDRSDAEVRDIYVTRRVEGIWVEGTPVHDDGWVIAGCPVNGPAIDSRADDVVVAWFSAPENVPSVKVAFSADAGATFGEPVVVDDGNPAGRVDILMLEGGEALVTWIERTGGEAAEVRSRLVGPDGRSGRAHTLTSTTSTRPSGFPRMAALGDGSVVLAWTDATGREPVVRTARVRMNP
jgi:hypothetical protein